MFREWDHSHVIPDDGKDTYELTTMDYQENETDPSSSNINDINTCLHAWYPSRGLSGSN